MMKFIFNLLLTLVLIGIVACIELLVCGIVWQLPNFDIKGVKKKYRIKKLRKAFIGKTIMGFDGGHSSAVVLDARLGENMHYPYLRLYLDTGETTCIELSYYLSK